MGAPAALAARESQKDTGRTRGGRRTGILRGNGLGRPNLGRLPGPWGLAPRGLCLCHLVVREAEGRGVRGGGGDVGKDAKVAAHGEARGARAVELVRKGRRADGHALRHAVPALA